MTGDERMPREDGGTHASTTFFACTMAHARRRFAFVQVLRSPFPSAVLDPPQLRFFFGRFAAKRTNKPRQLFKKKHVEHELAQLSPATILAADGGGGGHLRGNHLQ